MDAAEPHRIALAGDTDIEGFRSAARTLVAQGVEPGRVSWQVATAAEAELFEPTVATAAPAAPAAPAVTATKAAKL